MRQNPLQLAAGRTGSCRADSTCRHQSEKGLVILAHCPFGPRGSTVSGRHLHATYGDFATTFASASFSFVCRACSCSHAWRVATAPRGVHSAVRPPAPPMLLPMCVPTTLTRTRLRPTWRGSAGNRAWRAGCGGSGRSWVGPPHQVHDALRHRPKIWPSVAESEGSQDLIHEPTCPVNRIRRSVP